MTKLPLSKENRYRRYSKRLLKMALRFSARRLPRGMVYRWLSLQRYVRVVALISDVHERTHGDPGSIGCQRDAISAVIRFLGTQQFRALECGPGIRHSGQHQRSARQGHQIGMLLIHGLDP